MFVSRIIDGVVGWSRQMEAVIILFVYPTFWKDFGSEIHPRVCIECNALFAS